MQDRLRRSLHQSETLLVISGYSFGDAHLNEIIFDAAARRERSEIVAFCHTAIPDVLAKRAAITPNIQVVTGKEAILGGVRGDWKPSEELPEGLWKDDAFVLPAFHNLAAFLARSVSREPEGDAALKALLAAAGTTSAAATGAEGNG